MKFKNVIDMIEKVNKEVWNVFEEEGKNTPITELQIHKILFILYGFFWKKYKVDLYEPNFEAWKYGPVEINYRKNKDNEIEINNKFEFLLDLDEKQIEFLEDLIQKCLKKGIWTIVHFTHETTAWLNSYKEDDEHCPIQKELIRNSFENIEYWN